MHKDAEDGKMNPIASHSHVPRAQEEKKTHVGQNSKGKNFAKNVRGCFLLDG